MIEDLLWDALVYVVFPTTLASAVAFLFWWKRRIILGNAVGSGVIAIIMTLFILQRFASFTAKTSPVDDPLMPLIVLALVGWLDVFILFFVSGLVEDRVKQRVMNPDDF